MRCCGIRLSTGANSNVPVFDSKSDDGDKSFLQKRREFLALRNMNPSMFNPAGMFVQDNGNGHLGVNWRGVGAFGGSLVAGAGTGMLGGAKLPRLNLRQRFEATVANASETLKKVAGLPYNPEKKWVTLNGKPISGDEAAEVVRQKMQQTEEGGLSGGAEVEVGGKSIFKGLPKGITFDGQIYRAVNSKNIDGALTIHPSNVAANHRYSAPGSGALYAATSPEALHGEMKHYGMDPQDVQIVTRSTKVENILDLTNPEVRRQLGISLDDLQGESYSMTQSIGAWARKNYSGILAPSARAKGTSNLILFNP